MKHHLCIHDAYSIFDGETIPYGTKLIEEKITEAIHPLLDDVVSKIGDDEVIVCGEDTVRRMVARKLEDRIKRPVNYE